MGARDGRTALSDRDLVLLRRYTWVLGLGWTLVVVASFSWNLALHEGQVLEIAQTQARVAHDKDVTYRAWNAGHGGVYVPIAEDTPPNPDLHVPERDIATPSGRKLTLINPAYMTRQAHGIEQKVNGVLGHLTSLRPLRSGNAPDEWERAALEAFEKGAEEVSSLVTLDGREYMRLMQPLMTKKGCLKCHGDQGYEVGDIRGGISASVPMAPLRAIAASDERAMGIAHASLWLLGLLGLGFGSMKLRRSILERQEAEKQQAKLAAAVEHSSDSIIITGVDGRIEYVNPAFEEATGYASEEVLGRPQDSIQAGAVVPMAEGRDTVWEGCHKSVRKDGTEFSEIVSISPVHDDSGEIINFVAVRRDVTKELALQDQLHQARKLEAIGSLAAGIAHEINTPNQYIGDNGRFLQDSLIDLNEVLNQYSKLLDSAKSHGACGESVMAVEASAEDADLDYLLDETPKAISQILEGVERVTEIVSAMKEFSHPGVKEKISLDLNQAIKSTATVSRSRWKSVAEMEFDFANHMDAVLCLPGEFNQVILNLITNAADAISDVVGSGGDRMGKIKIQTRQDGDWVEIRVSDTGGGIPVEAQERIFDQFFTTKDVGSGTGQGLSISRSVIVEKHGGSLTFDTQVGEGTTFIIRMPVCEAELAPSGTASGSGQ